MDTSAELPDDACDAVQALDTTLAAAIDDGRPIDALLTVRVAGEVLQARSKEAAQAAAEGAFSWADVGEALGVSRQAAHQKLSTKIDEKRRKLDQAEARSREKIDKTFDTVRAKLSRHEAKIAANPKSAAKLAKLQRKLDERQQRKHDKLSKGLGSVRAKLDEISPEE